MPMLTTLLLQTANTVATGASLDWNGWITLVAFITGGIVTLGGFFLMFGRKLQELQRNTQDIKDLFDAQDEAAKISLQTSRNLDRLTDRFDNLMELLDAGVVPKRRGANS